MRPGGLGGTPIKKNHPKRRKLRFYPPCISYPRPLVYVISGPEKNYFSNYRITWSCGSTSRLSTKQSGRLVDYQPSDQVD
jgi:hypothetical protein